MFRFVARGRLCPGLFLPFVVASCDGDAAVATNTPDASPSAPTSPGEDAGANVGLDAGADAGQDADADAAPPLPTVCPAPATQNDFEAPLDPTWTLTDPTAFRTETVTPITGAQSLRLAYRQRASYVTIPMPPVCAIRLKLTFRADARLLGAGQVTMARIAVGAGLTFHLVLGTRGLSLLQEMHTPGSIGIGFGRVVSPVLADTPTFLVLAVDLRTMTTQLAIAVGTPLPAVQSDAIALPEGATRPTAITGVQIGSTAGVESSGTGIVLFDDLAID